MFKKCVSSGSHTQLSKSDAKKLRKAAAETMGVDEALLERALRPNPAGNANQRTPLVVVRPQQAERR